ncbi:hypothetical protein C0Q70_17761 [Pomacea canaliculata]|uniref:Uncharacterized protein n=1 Tax=Pomacea canaliculata TaxID=400727 RepID=A0A2T7NLB3_POMCA|nr:hypothetical protein C0Q70_17761 [Pomacea canaliculata]
MADGEFVEDPDQRINNTTLSSGVDDAKSRFTDSAPRKPESVTKQVPPTRGGGGVQTEVKGIVCYRLQSEGNQFSSICRLRPRHPPPPKIVWVTKSVASYRSTLDSDRT